MTGRVLPADSSCGQGGRDMLGITPRPFSAIDSSGNCAIVRAVDGLDDGLRLAREIHRTPRRPLARLGWCVGNAQGCLRDVVWLWSALDRRLRRVVVACGTRGPTWRYWRAYRHLSTATYCAGQVRSRIAVRIFGIGARQRESRRRGACAIWPCSDQSSIYGVSVLVEEQSSTRCKSLVL